MPEQAAEIVNNIWGLNGVPERNRLAVLSKVYQMGRENPSESEILQRLFSEPN